MEQVLNKIRVRFAPSPTGFMHIGSLRTALYNYLFSKKNGGVFVLRIEDTDQKRFIKGALESLIKTLEWAGLDYDEGVFKKNIESKIENKKTVKSKNYPGINEIGEHGPYIQSEKLEVYKKYAEELVKKGQAYYCFCEPKRLEEMRRVQTAKKQPPIYDRYCLRNITPEEINKNLKSNCPYVIRLKVPENETIEFDDIIRGKVKFNTSLIDDQVLVKSDGYPTYHLANVVDDHEMKITHVIRGEEWLSSTPKHILLYRYFGWEEPKFSHLPLLLNPDKTKLSKRQGDVAVEDYVAKGYLKEAIINFVAMLGWNPGGGSTQEIFTLDELIQKFDLAHVHKGGAVFDIKKLDWINSQWIKKLSIDDLYNLTIKFLEPKEFYQNAPENRKIPQFIKKVLAIEQERLIKLSEVGGNSQFLFQDIACDKELLRWKNMPNENLVSSLKLSFDTLNKIGENEWTKQNLEKKLLEVAGEKRGELLWPLRVALTGQKKSPTPFEVAWALGKEESLKRIKKAIEKIN